MDIYGIIGWPVKHSLSPYMHNRAFKYLGIRAVYGLFPVEPPNLSQAIEGIRALGIKGVSVTIPYKEKIISMLDQVDPIARKIGAVNTIVNQEGKLLGFNTDWLGVKKALEEKIPLKGKKAIIIGAGGSARAVIYALNKAQAFVAIYNRTISKAQKLAQEFGGEAFSLEDLYKAKGDILINTTSVGLKEEKSIVPISILKNFTLVMDIVYIPLYTRLLKDALEQGCQIQNGLKMLVYQGQEQFFLWTNQRPPYEIMEAQALKALEHGDVI